MLRAMIGLLALLLGLFGAFLRSRRDLVFENLLLRHQLAVALRSRPRSTSAAATT